MTKKDKKQFDDVLKRMLGTPPDPHAAKPQKPVKKKNVASSPTRRKPK